MLLFSEDIESPSLVIKKNKEIIKRNRRTQTWLTFIFHNEKLCWNDVKQMQSNAEISEYSSFIKIYRNCPYK